MKNDEYQFPKDEYLAQADSKPSNDTNASDDESATPDVATPSVQWAFLKNRKAVMGILLAVVIMIGLKLMHHDPAPLQPTPAAEQAPVAPAAFVLPTQNIGVSPAVLEMQSHLSNMRSQLDTIATANTQLTQTVSALTTQVAALSSAVEGITQKLASMTPVKTMITPRRIVHHQPPVIYVLKAVVPGRAWLVGSNGISVSVSAKNYLSPYYGWIRSINASSGQVMTSSGKTITYGKNDS